MPAIVQLPWMLMANPNLLQKHAKSFIYAMNLNETGYIGLFFLTEKIYEKICLRKGLIWGNLIFKNFFLWQKTARSQNWGSLHTTSVLKWFCRVSFHLSSVTIEISVLRSNALKPNKSVHGLGQHLRIWPQLATRSNWWKKGFLCIIPP